MPELEDFARAYSRVIDGLEPDVLHVHHPSVLPLALRAARRLRAQGRVVHVVYDARENFAGIPSEEQGSVRRHAVLVRQEARCIAGVDAVLTVSAPIAGELQTRYRLPRRPAVVLNAPVLRDRVGEPVTTVRDVLQLPADVPLVVYSGVLSRARGLEVLVDALAACPDVHLVLVTVPHPHPLAAELFARARDQGLATRVHALPPVEQDLLVDYLSGADVAVHPLPGGSPNHDQALPNKLLEYLHSGLPLVVSDARLMASFVRDHDLGEVFRSGDAADLAAALRRALARPRGDRRGLAAQFSWQQQETAIRDVYAALLPAPPRPAEPFPALDVR